MRVGLLSDIHANAIALRAVLDALGQVDALWVTGDTVGYGADPEEVLAMLRDRDALLVQGNHDLGVATGDGLDLFHDRAATAARMHADWLGDDTREWLRALPRVVSVDRFTLCHGSLRDPLWEYVTGPAQAEEATLTLSDTPFACSGHTHIPSLFVGADAPRRGVRPTHGSTHPLRPRTLLNPGSVGQPRDRDPRAAYAVVDTEGASVTFYRAEYEIDEEQRRIRARGLPEMFAERLAFGI